MLHARHCEALAYKSLSNITAVAPQIGYMQAAALAKEALKSRRSVLELVVERGLLSEAQARKAMDPHRLSKVPGT